MNTLEDFLSVLDKVQGLPAVGLVFLSCIVLGYIWRLLKWKWFPNEVIPLVVVNWGAFCMSMLADPRVPTMPPRVWFFRNVVVGAIIGFGAWLVHATLIKRIEKWILGKAPSLGDTSIYRAKSPATEDKTISPQSQNTNKTP